MLRELDRLVSGEGFMIHAGSWEAEATGFSRSHPVDAAALRRALANAPGNRWAGFQVYYPMRQKEVRSSAGIDLVESMLAVFVEVTPAMNLCMQIRLEPQSTDRTKPKAATSTRTEV